MMKLVQTEWKKIWKSRINLLLFVILCLFSGIRCYENHHSYGDSSRNPILYYQDVNGNRVDESNYMTTADQTLHAYAGELNVALLETMKHDYLNIMNTYPRNEIDKELMVKAYGPDYETLIKKAENGEFTMEEVYDYFADYMSLTGGINFSELPDTDKVKVSGLRIFDKNEHVRKLYQRIYGVWEDGQENESIALPEFPSLKTYLNDEVQNLEEPRYHIRGSGEVLLDEQIKQYMISHSKQMPKRFDSVVGNNLLIASIYDIEFLSLIFIILILSNSFAMEKHYKTDQILIPTAKGNQRITAAKIIAGISTSFVMILTQILLVIGLSICFTPIRDLSLPYFSQAQTLLYYVIEFACSYQELLWNAILLMSIACIATAIITLFASYLTKNRFFCAIPLFAFTLITGFATPFVSMSANPYIDPFMPAQMMHFTQFFSLSQLIPYVNISGHVIAWKDIIMVFWIVVCCILSAIMYLHAKRHFIRNC